MKEKAINKDKIIHLIEELTKRYKVFAPVEEEGRVIFSIVDSPQRVFLNYRNSDSPPKEFFFPLTEGLFRFRRGVVIEEPKNLEGRIIWGIRPCDVKSLTLLDLVFGGEDYKDPYFLKRRENTIIVSLACTSPRLSCFCTSLNTGPADEEGSDLMFFEVEEDYQLKAITKKGEELLKGLEGLLHEVDNSDLRRRERVIAQAIKKVSFQIKLEGIKERLDGLFASPLWDSIHERCLGCGVCTYLCPTCHCFDISDEAVDGEGRRVRSWDSCMYPLFTLHASGHNPRLSNKERFRQRIMHKFNYFIASYNKIACVGCGRCLRNCPVNIDIREVVKEIQESA